MKNTTRRNLIILIISVIISTLVLCLGVAALGKSSESSETASATVDIIKDGKSDYKIIFAAKDAFSEDIDLAADVSARFGALGIRTPYRSDVNEKESAHEILIGLTNRPLSSELSDMLNTVSKDKNLVWGYTESDGKLAFLANSKEAFERGKADFLALFAGEELSVEAGVIKVFTLSRAEYEAELKAEEDRIEAEKEAARLEYIESLKTIKASFDMEPFYTVNTFNQYNLSEKEGGKQDNYPLVKYGAEVRMTEYVMLPENDFPNPKTSPVGVEHPYVYFSRERIDKIRETMNDPYFASLTKQFWALADTENFTGVFEERTSKYGNPYHYDNKTLAVLEAKALAYLLTGDERYGLEAVIGAKNAMLTISYIMDIHMDPYHGFAALLEIVSRVYDWCYDLLDEVDKNQFILGVQNRLCTAMEYNLFRKGQGLSLTIPFINAVSGHGMGAQFIVKYVNMALSFYHEVPNWWDYIGGKYFDKNVPVYSAMYTAGYATQGTAVYAEGKYINPLFSAYCIYNSTGIYPDFVDMPGMRDTAYHLLSQVMANGRYFQTGDGDRTANGTAVSYDYMLVAAAVTRDKELFDAAKKFSSNFANCNPSESAIKTVPMILILSSYYTSDDFGFEDAFGDSTDTISYFGHPNGFLSARDSWGEDAAVVIMKIGEKTMANHDIADHGTFQIYYKGILAGSSGAYNKYGSYVHKYYLQSTVAHNGVLIFDPSEADETPRYSLNSDGTENKSVILNHARYYYSGSQRRLSETSELSIWLSDTYTMASVTGVDYEYNFDGSPEHAYIAGDLTRAYYQNKVNYVGRRMLAVYTGNEDAPMMFFVFDNITTTSPDFTKTFLLHTVKEPAISDDGLEAVIKTDDGGQMNVRAVSGAEKITKIGGSGYAFWINGKNCVDEYAPDDQANKIWGRLEVNMTGKLNDKLLTAMYVSDSTKNVSYEIENLTSSPSLTCAKIGDTVAVFANSESAHTEEASFNSGEEGLLKYYVSGLFPGEWEISFDGIITIRKTVEEGSGFTSFKGPAGNVTIRPAGPFPKGAISYKLSGGKLSEDAPHFYYNNVTTELPTPTHEKAIFDGWYTDSSLSEDSKIEYIDGSVNKGRITLYAKWKNYTLLDADYSKLEVNADSTSSKNIGGVNHATSEKTGASFTTVTENGATFLRWIKGYDDSFLTSISTNDTIASRCGDEISYFISFSKDGNAPTVVGHVRLMATSPATGKNSSQLFLLHLTNEGKVKLGDSGPVVHDLSDGEIFNARLVIDFKNEELRLYDADGNATHTTAFVTPKIDIDGDGVTDTVSAQVWRTYLTKYLFYWYSNSNDTNEALRIYKIKIADGNIFA